MEILGVHVTFWNCLVTWVTIVTVYIICDWLRVLAWRRKYKLKGPLPLPLIGTFYTLIGKTFDQLDRERLRKYGPIYVSHIGAINCIQIVDLQLLKKIFIREHVNFQNRYNLDGLEPRPIDVGLLVLKDSEWKRVRSVVTPTFSPAKFKLNLDGLEPRPIDVGLLVLKDSEWKRVRSVVTPTFSPAKFKLMTNEINFCAGLLVESLTEKAVYKEPVDIRHHMGCYTMDVIAGTAFGIRTCSYKNPDQPFVYHADRVFSAGVLNNPLLLLFFFFPKFCKILSKYFGLSFFFPLKSVRFFSDVIQRVMEERKQTNEKDRVDMIGLLMNAQEAEEKDTNTSKRLTHEELVAMGFLAFIGGYDSTATLLSFVCYVMAIYPDIQEKVIVELDAKYKSDELLVQYDDMPDLPFLDQVVCETLRMYPPILRMNRTTSHNKDVMLEGHWFPGNTILEYSIWQVHHEMGFYEEPDRFKPERFSPEEKRNRDPVTFMPFGHGPRSCIGMRLALLETKVAIIHVLHKMRLVTCPETQVPLDLVKETFLRPRQPIKIGVEFRKDRIK